VVGATRGYEGADVKRHPKRERERSAKKCVVGVVGKRGRCLGSHSGFRGGGGGGSAGWGRQKRKAEQGTKESPGPA